MKDYNNPKDKVLCPHCAQSPCIESMENCINKENSTICCNDNLSSCFCDKNKNHKGLHKCRCGGSWDKNKNPHSSPATNFKVSSMKNYIYENMFDIIPPEEIERRAFEEQFQKRLKIVFYPLLALFVVLWVIFLI